MIIIDIIKRIHHKTKRKCRRYHEIIINDDQKEVIENIELLVYNLMMAITSENRFSSNTRTFQLYPSIYSLITF